MFYIVLSPLTWTLLLFPSILWMLLLPIWLELPVWIEFGVNMENADQILEYSPIFSKKSDETLSRLREIFTAIGRYQLPGAALSHRIRVSRP